MARLCCVHLRAGAGRQRVTMHIHVCVRLLLCCCCAGLVGSANRRILLQSCSSRFRKRCMVHAFALSVHAWAPSVLPAAAGQRPARRQHLQSGRKQRRCSMRKPTSRITPSRGTPSLHTARCCSSCRCGVSRCACIWTSVHVLTWLVEAGACSKCYNSRQAEISQALNVGPAADGGAARALPLCWQLRPPAAHGTAQQFARLRSTCF